MLSNYCHLRDVYSIVLSVYIDFLKLSGQDKGISPVSVNKSVMCVNFVDSFDTIYL